MEDRQIICQKCGEILKEAGTDQNGKYKTCGSCNAIVTKNT
jgi:formylmethanofuran dehydrogenase subunit E